MPFWNPVFPYLIIAREHSLKPCSFLKDYANRLSDLGLPWGFTLLPRYVQCLRYACYFQLNWTTKLKCDIVNYSFGEKAFLPNFGWVLSSTHTHTHTAHAPQTCMHVRTCTCSHALILFPYHLIDVSTLTWHSSWCTPTWPSSLLGVTADPLWARWARLAVLLMVWLVSDWNPTFKLHPKV